MFHPTAPVQAAQRLPPWPRSSIPHPFVYTPTPTHAQRIIQVGIERHQHPTCEDEPQPLPLGNRPVDWVGVRKVVGKVQLVGPEGRALLGGLNDTAHLRSCTGMGEGSVAPEGGRGGCPSGRTEGHRAPAQLHGNGGRECRA
eukprot:362925-Chlamydomonas_euryale.AAC.4